MEATYNYQDYFTKQRHSVRCELLGRNNTTATIRLLGYGPKGRPPGTTMRVKLKSVGIRPEPRLQNELNWHDWTDQ